MTTERERAIRLLPAASSRVLRTVDRLQDDEWSTASLLPGWSRAHVVAHLALNAEALARCLHGVVPDPGQGLPRSMYDSDERRDSDIAELAGSSPTLIRDRLLAATTIFAGALAALPDGLENERVERTPGGRVIRAGAIPGMRWRELEIHHVDLGLSYSRSDWDSEFATHLLDSMVKRLAPDRAVEIRPLDSDRTWVVGDGQAEYPVPVVTGPTADVGWWLTGRPAPSTLSCSHGELPVIEGW